MDFYNTMTKTVWGYTDELSMGFCNDHTIRPSEQEVIMDTPRSRKTQLLLNVLAMKLHRGDLAVFSKMVQIMKLYKRDADLQQLVTKMQARFEALDQSGKSIGMYHQI